jgi:hypothetical protein
MSEERSEYKISGDAKPTAEPRGISCRVCGCQHLEVTHTEKLPDGMIRRRRTCRNCGNKFVTFESVTRDFGVRRNGKQIWP